MQGNIPEYLEDKLITNFQISNRSTRGQSSSTDELTHGVPQGSVLAPLLFLVFINDLPTATSDCDVDIFADDTTVSVSSDWTEIDQLKQNMTENACNLLNWSSNNKMILHTESKTTTMLLPGKRLRAKLQTDQLELNIKLNQDTLQQVSSHKLLGLTIDEDLTFDSHIDNLCKKLTQRIGLLRRIRTFLPLKERELFYSVTIKPLLMYGSSVCQITQRTTSCLQSKQIRFSGICKQIC